MEKEIDFEKIIKDLKIVKDDGKFKYFFSAIPDGTEKVLEELGYKQATGTMMKRILDGFK